MSRTENWIETRIVVDDDTIARGDIMEIVAPVWWTASFYGDHASYTASLAPFSEPQRLVWAMSWYQAEVMNGGHDQFFDNTTGMVWQDALLGFGKVAPEVHNILGEAVRMLGGSPAFDHDQRSDQLGAFYDAGGTFNDLDARIFGLPRQFDLEAAVLSYIRANASAFHFDGLVKKPAN